MVRRRFHIVAIVTSRVRVLTINVIVGSFDLPMLKYSSKSTKNNDSASLIVNIDNKSKKSSKATNEVQPRDGDATSTRNEEVKLTTSMREHDENFKDTMAKWV
jgi:hypothetical protein